MMKNILKIGIALMMMALVSCITNDLSFPDASVEIKTLTLEGAKKVDIDYQAHNISVILGETADIATVKVSEFTLAEKGVFITEIPQSLDLREPFNFSMKVYEEEKWTITATQPIERYIKCDNQIGDAILDVDKKVGFVHIIEKQDLNSITINSMKLEPEGSVVKYTKGFISDNGQSIEVKQDCNFPMILDCVVTRRFGVEYNGKTIEWHITFLPKAAAAEIGRINAWTYSAEIEGTTNGEGTPVFEYKAATEDSWKTFSDLNIEGTKATATITDLLEDTEYQVRLNNGNEACEPKSFRTGKALQLDNMNFDKWHQGDPHECWYPFEQGESGTWGTANPGTNFVSTVNPTKAEFKHVVKGAAVRLESLKALGVFAAGNMFTGRFVEFSFSAMAAYLEWGTPFKGRPYSLKGYYDYAPKMIDVTQNNVGGKPNPYKDLKGTMDNMQILAVLIDEAENEAEKGPFPVVSTKPGVPDLQNDPRVIAFGTIESSENTNGQYKEFECVLKYKDNREPDYVIVVACSSLRGNFFTGGLGSVLYADEFQFTYK